MQAGDVTHAMGVAPARDDAFGRDTRLQNFDLGGLPVRVQKVLDLKRRLQDNAVDEVEPTAASCD